MTTTKTFLKYSFFLGMLCVQIQSALAQQDPAYSMFMYNGIAINPAVAGSAEVLSVTALHRKQWSGIEGAPQTQTLNLDAPVWHDKVGLGLSVINDKIGVTSNLNVNTQYAYRVRFNNATLSMGLQAGFNNYHADYTSVTTNSQSATVDNSFSQNTNQMIFNFGSGAYLYSEKFFAGFSVPHILDQRLDGITVGNAAQSRQYRHYFLTGGYVFDAGPFVKVKPSTLIKVAEGAPVQVDVNTNVWYKERVSLGISWRTNDSFTIMTQLQLGKEIRIGYAYDHIISSLSRFTSGNNEIMIRFEPRKKINRILTPRYF